MKLMDSPVLSPLVSRTPSVSKWLLLNPLGAELDLELPWGMGAYELTRTHQSPGPEGSTRYNNIDCLLYTLPDPILPCPHPLLTLPHDPETAPLPGDVTYPQLQCVVLFLAVGPMPMLPTQGCHKCVVQHAYDTQHCC